MAFQSDIIVRNLTSNSICPLIQFSGFMKSKNVSRTIILEILYENVTKLIQEQTSHILWAIFDNATMKFSKVGIMFPLPCTFTSKSPRTNIFKNTCLAKFLNFGKKITRGARLSI